MIERYKILGAMLALGKFTIPEIVEHTGVKSNTVYTVLKREGSYIECLGTKETGRRGGKLKQYKIRPGKVVEVRSILEKLYGQMPIPAPIVELQGSNNSLDIPLGIIVAEDTLEHEYRDVEKLEEKRQLLEIAEMEFEKGKREARSILAQITEMSGSEKINSYLHKVEALIELRRADLAVEELALRGASSNISKSKKDPLAQMATQSLEKAASQLQILVPQSNRTPSKLSLNPQPASEGLVVVLIDGIDGESDPLTDRISRILSERGIKIQKTKWQHITNTIANRGSYIITVDSSAADGEETNAIDMCRQIFNSGYLGEKTVVFDLHANNKLRNLVIGTYQSDYQSEADKLDPNSILNTLNLSNNPVRGSSDLIY